MIFKIEIRTLLLLIISGVVLLGFSACEEEPEEDLLEIGTVYTPSNDYVVAAAIHTEDGELESMIIHIFDPSGNRVTDAQVVINDEAIPYLPQWGIYADTNLVLDYSSGTVYSLSITIDGAEIAAGIAQMPTSAVITSPEATATHLVNQPLTMTFTEIQYATMTYLYLDFWNPDLAGSYADTTLELSNPESRSYTIESSLFQYPGSYKFWLTAISGLTELPALLSLWDDFNFGPIGYNIKGPRGCFIVGAGSNYIKLTVTQ